MIRVISQTNDTVWAVRMRAIETPKASSMSRDISAAGLVVSRQQGIHAGLEKLLQRHLNKPWSQPLHRPSVDSYQRLKDKGALDAGQPFILDSGCGTGKSTQQLASRHPDYLVIGVDRSRVRLAKSGMQQNLWQRENCILLRADLPTFWRMLASDGFIPSRHFLFYPNPWPKPGHLKRRWHGHPVFPSLLALGGEIEMRCNWEIYALEFAQAVSSATGVTVVARKYLPQRSVSPFEKKYIERTQQLFSVTVPRQLTDAFRCSYSVSSSPATGSGGGV